MPRQSFIVLELVFRKLEKTITAAFLCRVRVSEHLWESWDVDMSVEQHGYDCSYALARESPPVTLREGALKKGSWLVQGFAYTFVCNSAGSGPSDPMSALEGAPGCVGAVRGGCAIFFVFSLICRRQIKKEAVVRSNGDCRNRRMRFQHRDYDNGRYLDEPNFRSNFIHQSTYSTVKSSLVQDQGNTSLKYIESQSRLLLTCLRLPNTPRQAKRAEGHRPQAKRQRGRQENFA